MSGESTTWDLFRNQRTVNTSWSAVDYVFKWVEAMPCKAADAKNSKKMFEETNFQDSEFQGW